MNAAAPIIALGLLASPALAEQAACRVLDPELQGSYRGDCDSDGLANGHGEAQGQLASYTGQFRAGKKHGPGIKIWPATGDRYEGLFADDYRQGWGVYRWGAQSKWAGESYEGQYQRDLREGYGVYFWANGDKFSGTWKQNLRYGESYMETRRKQSEALLLTHADTATPVCKEVRMGLEDRILLRGTLHKVGDGKAEVTLDGVSEKLGLYSGPTIPLSDAGFDWAPCN